MLGASKEKSKPLLGINNMDAALANCSASSERDGEAIGIFLWCSFYKDKLCL